MFTVEAGGCSPCYCDGMSLRSFLRLGLAGMASIGLPEILRAREAAPAGDYKDTTCILIWLNGGPSHLDRYDMKP